MCSQVQPLVNSGVGTDTSGSTDSPRMLLGPKDVQSPERVSHVRSLARMGRRRVFLDTYCCSLQIWFRQGCRQNFLSVGRTFCHLAELLAEPLPVIFTSGGARAPHGPPHSRVHPTQIPRSNSCPRASPWPYILTYSAGECMASGASLARVMHGIALAVHVCIAVAARATPKF